LNKNDTKIFLLSHGIDCNFATMKKLSGVIGILAAMVALLTGCEKDITIDLPQAETKIVVQGSIEPGQPPIVILSYSSGYFDPADANALANSYVQNAQVKLVHGTDTIPLEMYCTADMTLEQLLLTSQTLGLPPEAVLGLGICVYTSLSPQAQGMSGETYTLIVDKDNHHLQAVTKVNFPVPLDSLWFASPSGNPLDSLGFIYGNMTDPDSLGNAYRWSAKRISHYPQWITRDTYLRGQQKDLTFISPLPSVYDDEFFNGLSFEFAYYRGAIAFSDKFDDRREERGFFKRGDTVVVRGCSIDMNVYKFYKSYEDQLANQGSPFASPSNVKSNVLGGLGVWAGYGAYYDTLVCQ
jgi:hypothetical protein